MRVASFPRTRCTPISANGYMMRSASGFRWPRFRSLTAVNYTVRAYRLIDELHDYYRSKGWIEASISLDRASQEAERKIVVSPDDGLSAPRPYPGLRNSGEMWLLVRPYWVAYRITTPPLIIAVFHDTADIPARYT